jgi:hypothetical protein
MTKVLAALLLSLSGLTVAVAGHHREHFAAPEIDPSSAITALTMLLGGVTVLRSRIAKK